MRADEALRLQPDFRIGAYETALHYRNEGDREHHREGMLKAGLPA